MNLEKKIPRKKNSCLGTYIILINKPRNLTLFLTQIVVQTIRFSLE